MLNSYKEENWNMVIRNAQESVECYLKGILKLMNIEFPKEHDIGDYFGKIFKQKKITVDNNILDRIKLVSEELTKKRAPAYYGEEFYTREEAEEAKNYAEFIRNFVKDLLEKLK
ncbi:MAG: HEPN domain-containing protein [Candidatus Omnitrophica bacterium]|nr:HEPN domain-containing protein [Candidatus Omnitrophota bacterium]